MKSLRISMRFLFILTTLLAVTWAVLKDAVRQKFVTDQITAQGGLAFSEHGVQFVNGESIFRHCLRPVTRVSLKTNFDHPVDEQLAWLQNLPKLRRLKIQAQTKADSALNDTSANWVPKNLQKLEYLVVEGATCSNAKLRELRDKMPQTQGWLKRHKGASITLSSNSMFVRLLNDFCFRDGYGEPAKSH